MTCWHWPLPSKPDLWLVKAGSETSRRRRPPTSTMSVQDASQQPALPSSLQPEAKPRPEIPPKPSTQACSTSEDGDSSKNRPGGKVQRIVNKFSKQDPAAEEQPTNGTAEPAQCINLKNPPPVKPKPRRSQPIHIEVEQAPPPLPMKRGTLQKPRKCVQREEGDSASVAGGRSGTVDFIAQIFLIFGLVISRGKVVWHDLWKSKRNENTKVIKTDNTNLTTFKRHDGVSARSSSPLSVWFKHTSLKCTWWSDNNQEHPT